MSSLRYAIQNFARELEAEHDAASDLWSWLPSYGVAKKHHGDYAHEFSPSHADIMKEAAIYLAQLKHGKVDEAVAKEWFLRCPCDEDHGDE